MDTQDDTADKTIVGIQNIQNDDITNDSAKEIVFVHLRVIERHPELSEKNVLDAWNNCIHARRREDKDSNEYIAIGSDQNGRLIEVVAKLDADAWLIYHAMTPPSKKTLKELALTGGSNG